VKFRRPKHAKHRATPPQHAKHRTTASQHTQRHRIRSVRDVRSVTNPLIVAPLLLAVTAAAVWGIRTGNAAALPAPQQSPKSVYVGQQLMSKPFAFAAADGSHLTTFMPIWYIGKALEAAGYTQSWNGQTKTWTLGTAASADFSTVPVGSGEAQIVVNGHLVRRLPMAVQRDPAASKSAQATTYMPIYYIQQVLRAAGLQSTWNGQSWKIDKPVTPAKPLTVLGFVTRFQQNETSLNDLKSHPEVNAFSAFASVIGAGGTVLGAPSATERAYAASAADGAFITVANLNENTGQFDAALTHQVLSSPTATAHLVTAIVNLVRHSQFQGVTIDFELMPSSERADYAQFLTTLSGQLQTAGKQLQVAVPGVTYANTAYNLATIGRVSSSVLLMAYDYSYPGGPAGAIAPLWWVNDVLSYATKSIPASKIILGLPFYGYDWHGGKTTAVSLPTVDKVIAANHIHPSWDAKDQAPYFTYTTPASSAGSRAVTHTVYYENASSMKDKLALVGSYHLQGISIWHMDLEDQAVWSAVQQYLQQ